MKKILAVFAVFGDVLMSANIEDKTLKAIFENFEKSSKKIPYKLALVLGKLSLVI